MENPMSHEHYVDATILGGLSSITGLYTSGLPTLLGSRAQVVPAFIGVIIGSLAFGVLSSMVLRRVRLAYLVAIPIIVLGVEAYYVGGVPLVGQTWLAVLFSLACSPIIVLGRLIVDGRPSPHVRGGWLGVSAGLGGILFFTLAVIVYAKVGYADLPYILLSLDALGFGLVFFHTVERFVEHRSPRNMVDGGAPPQQKMDAPPKRALTLAVLASLIALLVCLSPVAQAADEFGLTTRTPIKHMVFIMMENHSFDNFFGVYPTDNLTNATGLAAQLTVPINLVGFHAPPNLEAVPAGVYNTADPVEGYIAYHRDWDHGKLDGFASNSGPQSMMYYTSAQLGVEWALAEQYAIADMYFASQLSETAPNRLYSLAGFSPVVNDYGPPPYVPFSESIFAELNAYGVSWAYYVENPSKGVGTLNYFQGIQAYSAHIQSWSQFLNQLANGTLPAVSWVMPIDGGAEGYSQGPPTSVLQGELWLLYIVNAVEQSPEWNTTAVFITYDEGGGFYDQVPPPTLDGIQLGQRVPMILISPYAKENYVSNTLLTHTSLLALIDYNWMMPALNTLVLHSNLPLDMFDFNAPYTQGYIIRPPIPFQKLGFPVPNTIYASTYPQPNSLSQLFPMTPQIPLNALPYQRVGADNLSLANISGQVFVQQDHGYTPAYASPVAASSIYIVILGLIYIVRRRQ
ncbi:MAG: alkaline phosphatase family protein [Thermoprotei archaeon]